jgi:exodeoxyribonuclease VII large subunit
MTADTNRHMYTVSKLTSEIKSLLEITYPFIWVCGEISNLSTPASGHSYFSLKDDHALIQAVIFKNQKRTLKCLPQNGLNVIGLARISLYEPRGSYQLIFEYLEPEGSGSAQVAFELLKNKLHKKGYFDPARKKTIPFLPDHVSVVTSATGAAVKDILQIATRRFPNCRIDIIPVQVQGENAVQDICRAFDYIASTNKSNVIILARGGGSMEDLAAFNSEPVATAIFDCHIPVVTGIGHETDYTIADFTADLRASTPSAAAELVFPEKDQLVYTIKMLVSRLNQSKHHLFDLNKTRVLDLTRRLKQPTRQIDDYRFKIEDLESRLFAALKNRLSYHQEKISWLNTSLTGLHPLTQLHRKRDTVSQMTVSLKHHIEKQYKWCQFKFNHLDQALTSLNPDSVLKRGYSITRHHDSRKIIRHSTDVQSQDLIDILLYDGQLTAKVKQTYGKKENI